MSKILIVDDEKNICELINLYLVKEGYETEFAHTGKQAVEKFAKGGIDLVLLDVMLPEMDGWDVCREIRKTSNTPIIMLSAKGETFDKVLGLELGADDYITKPFNPVEVIARVRSQLRRYLQLGGGVVRKESYAIGGISLDDRTKQVLLDGEEITLTPKEYEILKLLLGNPGRVYSPKEIYKTVWKESPVGCDNTVAVHIRHLREKIEINPAEPRYLKVVWGQGYKIEEERR